MGRMLKSASSEANALVVAIPTTIFVSPRVRRAAFPPLAFNRALIAVSGKRGNHNGCRGIQTVFESCHPRGGFKDAGIRNSMKTINPGMNVK
jgi:hypothetical protein